MHTIPDSEKQNHAGIVLLSVQAAVEAEFESEILSTGDDELHQLFQSMQQKLIGLMKAENIPVKLRAECGLLLGQLGDYRPGVGV
ncbi:MAG: hypothetical protein V3U75_13935 [Methylococcaceae bacterium]